MRTPQRYGHPGVVKRLFRDPQHFGFFQALRVADQWLHLRHPQRTLEGMLRFRHSVSLSFPAGDIAALSLQGRQLHVSPAFMGYLGICGVLPYCYTDTIAAQLQTDGSGRAFFDTFCHRSLTLLYRAWQQGRVEYRLGANGEQTLLTMQVALAGAVPAGSKEDSAGVDAEVIAHYAALIRQRPASAAVTQHVLSEYFGLPFRVEPLVGGWENIPEAERFTLGPVHTRGPNTILGRRYWRRDLTRLWIGPLTRADFERFLPDGECTPAMKAMLALFMPAGARLIVRPILRAQDVQPIRLDHRTRLGYGSVLTTRPTTEDHTGTRYEVRF
jgi:type VI secretion system protein ImpH